ncbi:hypothetical protein [Pseudomonas putida]|uniref:hypothetical protein n=1 Tax=Pseudomonas putida TaxID=303 RepID=UPI00111C51D6|nr:hypothetical protein [Pseudomonas putida]
MQPIIDAENAALAASEALPTPDYDSIASFRLLVHAELEGYFEDRAKSEIDQLDVEFAGGKYLNGRMSSLIMLYLWRSQSACCWNGTAKYDADFKSLAQNALGFGRSFIKENNGIKENSIHTLSAIIGLYQHEIDEVLIEELNSFGKKRGAVAHKSWIYDTRTFDSAETERNNVVNIISLIRNNYENTAPGQPGSIVRSTNSS